MRAIINRVKSARLYQGNTVAAQTGVGYFIALGVAAGDTKREADKLADKITAVRSYRSTTGDLDIHIRDICGEILVVPDANVIAPLQGDTLDRGAAAQGAQLQELYENFVDYFARKGVRCVPVPDFDGEYTVEAELNGVVTYMIDTVDL